MHPSSDSSKWARKGLLAFILFVSVVLNIYALASSLLPQSREPENLEDPPSAMAPTVEPTPEGSTSTVAPAELLPLEERAVAPNTPSPAEDLSLPGLPEYGHFPYAEANPDDLVTVASFGLRENQRFEKLHPDAAAALMQMTNAARDEGVWIVLSSAFRKIDQQAELFVAQTQRRGSPEEAAKSSAPPGHSEHHTGYAMDLSDGHFPSADINQSFANTDAYLWLLQHAAEYGFELSFPLNNAQGVSYEPWHWRFVGTPAASATFSRSNSSE